jgi:hypothetical protein
MHTMTQIDRGSKRRWRTTAVVDVADGDVELVVQEPGVPGWWWRMRDGMPGSQRTKTGLGEEGNKDRRGVQVTRAFALQGRSGRAGR